MEIKTKKIYSLKFDENELVTLAGAMEILKTLSDNLGRMGAWIYNSDDYGVDLSQAIEALNDLVFEDVYIDAE